MFPAASAVGTTIDQSYFGPPPSSVNPSLIGPLQLLNSGTVDVVKGVITLPLYKGYMKDGTPVWYVLTDTTDPGQADLLGINVSTKLQDEAVGARTANFGANNVLIFDKGKIDFSPNRVVTAGLANKPFPASVSRPGSIGDADYSPYVRVLNAQGTIYNAPIVAYGVQDSQINFPNGNVDYSKAHDEVVAIDPVKRTVTLQVVNGYSFGHDIMYLSLDSSDSAVSGIEGNTYAPLLKNLVTGEDDSFSSPVERIFVATNGVSKGGCANPQRQGLYATLTDRHRPNNVFGGTPTVATDYSPAWDVSFWEWSPTSIANNLPSTQRGEFDILTFAVDGFVTGPDGTSFGDSGIIINCPPVIRLD